MNDLIINSAPGSGTTYCSTILQKAFGKWFQTTHQPHLLTEGGNQVYILRDPYNAIVSGLERHFQFMDSPDLQKFDISDSDTLKSKIKYYNTLYNSFLDDFERDNVLICVYEDMRNSPMRFVQKISDKFGIPIVESEVTSEWVEEKLVLNLSDPGYPKERRKRNIGTAEKPILKLEVEASDIVKQTYDRYWEYRNKIAEHNN